MTVENIDPGPAGDSPLEQVWAGPSLTERDRWILTGRLTMTLDELGKPLDVSRERVRQLETTAKKELANALRSSDPVACQSLEDALAREQMLSTYDLCEIFGTHASIVASVAAGVLGAVAQRVWGETVGDYWAHRGDALERRLKDIVAQAPFLDEQLEDLVQTSAVPPEFPTRAYLAKSESGIERHPEGPWWVRRRARQRDAAYLYLQATGEPRGCQAIAERIGLRENATRESMRRDERFVQLRPVGTWALAEWRLPGSDGPRDATEAVTSILSDQGPMSFAELKRQMAMVYPVTSWRIDQVLSLDTFGELPDGRVGLIRDGAVKTEESPPTKPDTVSVNSDGSVLAYKQRVDYDVLRGSGIAVPRYLAWALGLRSVPSERAFTVAASDDVLILRRSSSTSALSSLRAVALDVGAADGCYLGLVFNDEQSVVRVVHGCHPQDCPAANAR